MIQGTLDCFSDRILIQDDLVCWTGSDINEKISEIINVLNKLTMQGDRVAICFCNSAVQAVSILGVLVSGRIPVILNYSDVVDKSQYWLKGSKANVFIFGEDLVSFANTQTLILNREAVIVPSFSQGKNVTESVSNGIFSKSLVPSSGLAQIVFHPPQGTAFILYTSGSTGEPKEVLVPEIGVIETSKYLMEYFSLNAETMAPIVLSACHSMALNTQFFPTFFAGGRSYFSNLRLIINKVSRFFLQQSPTFVALIGEVVRTCWEEKNRRCLPPCESVEHVQLAGGLISPRHLEMTRELFPKAQIHKGYGLTVAIRVTMTSSLDPLFMTNSVGKVLPFLKAEIRDEEGNVLPAGQMGELYVKGPSVMVGYRRLSEISPRLSPRDTFLATGDLAEFDSFGNLYIFGRTDSLFKVNGQRVSGFEIEKAALSSDECIRFAKCLAVDDKNRGRSRMVLFLEIDKKFWRDGGVQLSSEIETQLWMHLKALRIYPKEVVFLRHMPLTSNGKLNIKKLHEISHLREMEAMTNRTPINLTLFQISEVL